MHTIRVLSLAAASIAVVGLTAGGRSAGVTAAVRADPAGTAGQVDLAVTVYNEHLALVRDVRDFTLQPGEPDLHFVDVASTVHPAPVHFRALSDPSRLTADATVGAAHLQRLRVCGGKIDDLFIL